MLVWVSWDCWTAQCGMLATAAAVLTRRCWTDWEECGSRGKLSNLLNGSNRKFVDFCYVNFDFMVWIVIVIWLFSKIISNYTCFQFVDQITFLLLHQIFFLLRVFEYSVVLEYGKAGASLWWREALTIMFGHQRWQNIQLISCCFCFQHKMIKTQLNMIWNIIKHHVS